MHGAKIIGFIARHGVCIYGIEKILMDIISRHHIFLRQAFSACPRVTSASRGLGEAAKRRDGRVFAFLWPLDEAQKGFT
jgi:hypothetical protein